MVINWMQLEKASYMYSCSHIQFSARYIHLLHAVLRHLADNEKMVLLQTCDQLKLH